MDINVLRNFLVVCEERNITKAAESLYISQSTLSRQMRDLEKELHTQLFVRSNRDTKLTNDGLIFRERASDIVRMADRTMAEFSKNEEEIKGEIGIACEQTPVHEVITDASLKVRRDHPGVVLNLYGSSSENLLYFMDTGFFDFAVIWEPVDQTKYNALQLPGEDTAGILMKRDSEFALHPSVDAETLKNMHLFVPHGYIDPRFPKKLNVHRGDLNFTGTYNLLDTVIPYVERGNVEAVCFQKNASMFNNPQLVFRPFTPQVAYHAYLIWRKHHLLSRACQLFLKTAEEML